MTSKITIEVNFDNGQPYIKVCNDTTSDDVRDKLITFFRNRLGSTSSWMKLEYEDHYNSDRVRFNIHPIRPDQLEEESRIMLEQVRLLQENPQKAGVIH